MRSKPPPNSLLGAVVSHPRIRLFVHPLLWTTTHLTLLRVSVRSGCSPLLAGPNHRTSCACCKALGRYNETAALCFRGQRAHGFVDQRVADVIQLASDSLLWEVRSPACHIEQYE